MKLSTDLLPTYFTIAMPNNSHYIVATNCFNFVDPVGITVDFVSWFRLLGITCNISACVGRTGLKRLQDVEQFTDNRVSYINWFNKIFDLSLHVDNICSSRKLVKQHPTAAGHEIWAKCIVESLK